jgi:hypothetical protein
MEALAGIQDPVLPPPLTGPAGDDGGEPRPLRGVVQDAVGGIQEGFEGFHGRFSSVLHPTAGQAAPPGRFGCGP